MGHENGLVPVVRILGFKAVRAGTWFARRRRVRTTEFARIPLRRVRRRCDRLLNQSAQAPGVGLVPIGAFSGNKSDRARCPTNGPSARQKTPEFSRIPLRGARRRCDRLLNQAAQAPGARLVQIGAFSGNKSDRARCPTNGPSARQKTPEFARIPLRGALRRRDRLLNQSAQAPGVGLVPIGAFSGNKSDRARWPSNGPSARQKTPEFSRIPLREASAARPALEPNPGKVRLLYARLPQSQQAVFMHRTVRARAGLPLTSKWLGGVRLAP
jgi:hypothetical protein